MAQSLALALALLLAVPGLGRAADCVVLLHGLGRSEASFLVMEEGVVVPEGVRARGQAGHRLGSHSQHLQPAVGGGGEQRVGGIRRQLAQVGAPGARRPVHRLRQP